MYGKVFDSIYDGTLYGHWEAIVTMQQFIVLATADGIVDMTPSSMAARTSIPVEILNKGILVLSAPDPHTRTPGEDGRRIVLLDEHRPWGWRLVNHWKYRALRDMAQKREADRDRIKKKRNENSDVATPSQCVANVAHTEAHTDADTDTGARAKRAPENQWWKSEQGIEAKGTELGMKPNPGESWSQYKSRIFDRLNSQKPRESHATH